MVSRRRIHAWLILFGTICVVVGCRGSEPERVPEHPNADTTTGKAAVDSSGQDTTSAEPDTVKRPGPVPPGPAPGTARVRAVVTSCDTTGTVTHCQLRIDEVLAYGSATPPIGAGERTVRFSSGLLDDRTLADLTKESRVYVLHHAGDRPVARDSAERESPIEWTARSVEPK